jgi:excisionase family DNA binding protein
MEKLMTPEEAARLLSVSPRTVKDWLRRGDLNGVKAGNLWRIRESDLERFLHKDEGRIKEKTPRPDPPGKDVRLDSGHL